MATLIYNQSELKNGDSVHTVNITSKSDKGRTINVKAYLPEEISMQAGSDWSAPWSEIGGNGTIATMLSSVGISMKTKPLSAQSWQGSSPVEVTLPLIFKATSDPKSEVMEPIVNLVKMVVPETVGNGQQFIPPGPTLLGYLKQHPSEAVRSLVKQLPDTDRQNKGEFITIRLGRFMRFSNIIITNVAPRIDTQTLYKGFSKPEQKGYPLRAALEVTFRLYTASDKSEVDSIFVMPSVG